MNQKHLLQTALCMVLCAAMMLGLLLPAADMTHAQPANPFENEAIREISILKVGENVSELDDIVVPNEDSVAPSEPKETQPPEETEPEESKVEETKPTQSQEPDEGNDHQDAGEEGGDELELDLAAVMVWYKYGTDPNTIACAPDSTVSKPVNVNQLENSRLKYEFTLAGSDAKYVDITGLFIDEEAISKSGTLPIELPNGTYTFLVNAEIEKADVRQELTFTFVLKCESNLDLDLELTWQPKEGSARKILCGADKTESFTVRNYDLTERVFGYCVQLTGSLAADARIVSASYTTSSDSGDMPTDSGTLILNPAPGSDQEVYHITFTARTAERDVEYRFELHYQEMLDVQLKFHWMEKGVTRRTATCDPDATLWIKNNQLSAGAIPYEMELVGADGEKGRFMSAAYTSDGSSGNLESKGSLSLTMPSGATSHTYRITVTAMVGGQRVNFEIAIHYSLDVSLQMEYTVKENGASATRQILCENTRTKTADAIYDDQLSDGVLRYTMTLTGSEGSKADINSVTCYQSGSGRTVTLGAEGEMTLLLKDGKTGENTFEIEAMDDAGNVFHFTINIPYKHRGENNIKIETNLVEDQEIINETKTNLTVRAWSEDGNGNVVSYIPANGTDTKLIVKLDGEVLTYVSSSGRASEFDLYPKNPEVGDTNTHKLEIYAEDALGNYGELTLTLKGQRRESGQQIGNATIYVDMTALGLGVVANLNYKVLADEPVSYVIAKAIMGMDTGEPFGAADHTLGWAGRYAGTLDNGFYLQSLTTGHNANALEGGKWPGSTEKEVLAAIDARFGAGTGLATLWRCLYRNGLNKSSGSGNSFGEMDYTSGSGWMYSVGGSTYYPGQSMSNVYLQDGDVLIVRYTLAYGWDVGGGSPGYGSTVGYCVSAVNGSIRVNHRIETVTNADGAVSNVCHCCGITEDCAHAHTLYRDLDDGTHIRFCNDCNKEIGDPADHGWTHQDDLHACADCGAEEEHSWKEVEGSNTATCTESGKRSIQCVICNMVKEEETGPSGHTLDNQWQITAQEHYEKCSTCGEITNQGRHQYEYITYKENGVQKETFECKICGAWHVDECDGTLTETKVTCQKLTHHCSGCGYDMTEEGAFPEHHHYVGGKCEYCGKDDPNGKPTEPPETEPPETEPSATEPPKEEPEPDPETQPEEGGEEDTP